MAAELGRTAARGAAVTLGGQGARIVLQFASIVVLARLLTPHDYGLLAIVTLLIGVGEIFRDFGLSSAAVRAPELSRGQSTNLFWTNTAIGVALALLLFGLSFPLAAIFDQPEVTPIAQVLSVVFLLNGLTTQFRALLMRDLRFRWLAGTDVSAAAIALGIAVSCAMLGWGYWALVAQQIAQALVVLLSVMLGTRWLPGWPRRDAPIGSFLRFGGNMVLSQVVNYATNNIDTALVGLLHSTSSLGLYNRAYQLVMTPLAQIQSPITSVAVPVLSRIQDDVPRFSAYLSRAQLAMGYPLCLVLAVVFAAADPLTALLLGPQWHDAVPLIQLFAVAGIARTLPFIGYWVYVTRGLSASLFRYTLVTSAIRIVCVLIGTQWGVIGIAAGLTIAPYIAWPISLFWLSRVTTIPTRELYAGAGRILLASILAGGAAFAAVHFGSALPDIAVIAAACVAALAVAALLCLLPLFRRDLGRMRELVALLRSRKTA